MILRIAFLAFALAASALADAQSPMRVRGTISAVGSDTLTVKTREGKEVTLKLPSEVAVAVAKAIRFEDIKQGDYVGATTVAGPGGKRVAVEVHYLAPTTTPGHGAWDLQPNSSMTNANVDQIVLAKGDRELTLKYKDGEQRIAVPEGIPLVRAVPGTRADLIPGEYIFAVATVGPDGVATAPRIQVSKDGVRPPQ